ncbi:hypothetical protein NSA24_06780 [Clostridioides mangenotii]|nr:hypothetical protein [Clostridioides mangenotii]MCR1954496.1 hypothetical protein [Clostridioides mangenotii]
MDYLNYNITCIADRTGKDIGMPIHSATKLDIQYLMLKSAHFVKNGNLTL